MDAFLLGILGALTPENLAFALVGCLIGTLVGVLPGIGPVTPKIFAKKIFVAVFSSFVVTYEIRSSSTNELDLT